MFTKSIFRKQEKITCKCHFILYLIDTTVGGREKKIVGPAELILEATDDATLHYK